MSRQKKGNTLEINGKPFVFNNSDIKLFCKLENAIDNLGRTLQKSGKIPDSERKTVLNDMTKRCLSVMILLNNILSSTLDVKCHSVRRVINTSQATDQSLLAALNTAASTGRTQTWLSQEIMSALRSPFTVPCQGYEAPKWRDHLCLKEDCAHPGRTQGGS